MVVKNALGNETSPLLSSSPALNFGDHVESRSSLGSYHVNMVSSVRKLSSQFSSLIAYHTGKSHFGKCALHVTPTMARIRDMYEHLNTSPATVSILHWIGTIGTFGSVSIAVNSLTGPAMLGLPALFARSGIIPTCCTVVVVAGLSSFCALHLANTISKVEGNSNFQKEIEYSTVFGFYLGPTWFNFTQVVFFFCILCLNVSSIVDTAQVVDTFFGNWWPWGGTAAININGDTVTFTRWDYSFCSEASRNDGLCSPFSQTEGSVLTLGNLVVTLFLLPLALLPLRESAWWQTLGFVILLLTSMQFIVTFLVSGLHMSEASWWGDDWDDLFGVILFNFALVIAVPAWLYEREPDVDVPSVVHGSCALSALLYILIGILGHMAIPNVNDNMLQSIMSGTCWIIRRPS